VYDLLNSPTALSIRQEIQAGRYFYCNNKICGFFGKINPTQYQSQGNIDDDYIPLTSPSQDLMLHQVPQNLIFDFDYTCNFRCPSCRTELINNNKHHVIRSVNNRIADKIKHLVIDEIGQQPVQIRWAGGEPFISEVYTDLFEYIIASGKQNIQHVIQTNGSYLIAKSDMIKKLLPTVEELRISFDAATAETYSRIRVNGIWNNLLDNVKWIKKYVDENHLPVKITADFVVQLDNYKEIPAFVELCNSLGIDKINFQKMWNWDTWSQEKFDQNNIYNPTHPQYQQLIDMFNQAGKEILY
jgi:MoaA/NifB/PqqE/SkfB family radical SAM enzyme